MEKLEKAKKKHDHKGTKILKLIIFSCVMLAPFFSILVRCLYILNPNAKDSYYGKTINEIVYQETNYNKMVYHEKYYLLNSYDMSTFSSGNVLWLNVSNFTDLLNNTIVGNGEIRIWVNSNNQLVAQVVGGGTYQLQNNNYSFVFNQILLETTQSKELNSHIFKETYNKYSYLDNAFEYSINQLGQSNYYNWTQNTGIYNGLNAMCTGLGVNNVIAILLTYWALCTAIYIVFDIVIELFTKLTHFINAD